VAEEGPPYVGYLGLEPRIGYKPVRPDGGAGHRDAAAGCFDDGGRAMVRN
jgi:hypothetical protein